MPGHKAARLFVGLFAAMAVLGAADRAGAQEKKIKIGVIYDLTGPLDGPRTGSGANDSTDQETTIIVRPRTRPAKPLRGRWAAPGAIGRPVARAIVPPSRRS